MEDMAAHLESSVSMRRTARLSATRYDMQKRELFGRLAEHLGVLASE